MIDFPSNPTVGQQFTSGGVTWTWDGVKWTFGPGAPPVTISATPPASPSPGALWWDSVGGQMYIWFNDGSSSQWVAASNSTPGPAGPAGAAGAAGATGPIGPAGPNVLPPGVTDGSNAAAGAIGEYLEIVTPTATSDGFPISSASWTTILTLNLTPGDWACGGDIFLTANAFASYFAQLVTSTTDTTGRIITSSLVDLQNNTGVSMRFNSYGGTLSERRYSSAAPQSILLMVQMSPLSGLGNAFAVGRIWARRMR